MLRPPFGLERNEIKGSKTSPRKERGVEAKGDEAEGVFPREQPR